MHWLEEMSSLKLSRSKSQTSSDTMAMSDSMSMPHPGPKFLFNPGLNLQEAALYVRKVSDTVFW